MEIRKINKNDPLIETLIKLSVDWANENNTEGYVSNTRDTFKNMQIYVALINNEVIGYLYGYFSKTSKNNSVQKINDRIFEIEELYIIPKYRNMGYGKQLYSYVEKDIKDNIDYILLSTATKDYKRILHFYIDELDMTFWNARLYKRSK